MLHFREELLHQQRQDLDRRLRLAFLLRGSESAPVARGRRWSSALTLLHLTVRARPAVDGDLHAVCND